MGLWKLTEVSDTQKKSYPSCQSNFNNTIRFSSDERFTTTAASGSCSFIAGSGSWRIQSDGKELVLDNRYRYTISRLTKTQLTLTSEEKGTIQRESHERVE